MIKKKSKNKQTNLSLRNKIEQKVAREFLLVMEFFRTPNKTSKPQNVRTKPQNKATIMQSMELRIKQNQKSSILKSLYIQQKYTLRN